MQIITDNIAEVECERLRKWLTKPEADIFVRVVESEIFRHEMLAVGHLQAATAGGDNTAKADVDNAKKCRYILDLFKQFRKQQVFTESRAVPSTRI